MRATPPQAAGESASDAERQGLTAPGGPQRWAVVGGGVLGMTLALRLAQHGHQVTLIERAETLGGLASAWRLGDLVWDRHYHVTLLSDTYLRELLSEFGLDDQMRWVETRTGFYSDGSFHSMSSSLDFLRFPPLGLVSKARLAATIMYASRITDWRPLENQTVAEWLQRCSGKKTFEKIWLPLLRAKLGESYHKTSAAFIWATIQRMYAARRTGLKKEMFGYLPGGYGRFFDTFRERLIDLGVTLQTGTEIRKVEGTQGAGVTLETGDGATLGFDRAVLTVPAPVAARLCPGLTEDENDRLGTVDYQGIVCASLLLKKPLGGYYITNITDSWVPFTAVIEMSALVDRSSFRDHTLVYLPRYLESSDPSFSLSDEEWRERFLPALFRMYPYLDEDDVLSFQVSREKFVYALPTLGYSRRVPAKRTSIPGVNIVTSAQILNGTLNVNESLKLATESLPEIMDSTGGTAKPSTDGAE